MRFMICGAQLCEGETASDDDFWSRGQKILWKTSALIAANGKQR
jgi:hypothetical protein